MERDESVGCTGSILSGTICTGLDNRKMTVGVAIITHCAKKHLPHCLQPLLMSVLKPRVVVVNSSSNDGTVELAHVFGAETLVVPRAEFNHGSTREKARKYLGTDIVVMITPDAYANEDALEKLVQPLLQGRASVAYAKQIPHDGAGFFESFARQFNYPEESHIRGIEEVGKYGIYTFFCSNSCAAYLNSALDEVGGFPEVLLGEDTIVVAKLLHKGHKIAYVAEAVVKHSHTYSLKQEFQRNFDIGLARKSFGTLLACEGCSSDSKRGATYVRTMCKKIIKERPYLLPYAILQSLIKFSAYTIGRKSASAPIWFKKRLSSQDFYWK